MVTTMGKPIKKASQRLIGANSAADETKRGKSPYKSNQKAGKVRQTPSTLKTTAIVSAKSIRPPGQ
jgi:hypothetical protein